MAMQSAGEIEFEEDTYQPEEEKKSSNE